MHVYASYSINLAEMGSNREEIHAIAARRAAEVRRRLEALTMAPAEDPDEVDFVKAVGATNSDPPVDAYSPTEMDPITVEQVEQEVSAERDNGSLFSARA